MGKLGGLFEGWGPGLNGIPVSNEVGRNMCHGKTCEKEGTIKVYSAARWESMELDRLKWNKWGRSGEDDQGGKERRGQEFPGIPGGGR